MVRGVTGVVGVGGVLDLAMLGTAEIKGVGDAERLRDRERVKRKL
jgi:hypothetical protein